MKLQTILCVAALVACASASGYYGCPSLFNFFPNVNDCTKFFRCVWGKPVAFKCPAGTRWSQKLLTCDYAYKVPCGHYPAAPAAHHAYVPSHAHQPAIHRPVVTVGHNPLPYPAHPVPHHVAYAHPSATPYAPQRPERPEAPAAPTPAGKDYTAGHPVYPDVPDKLNLYELSPLPSAYPTDQDLFRAGYGYQKVYYKKK